MRDKPAVIVTGSEGAIGSALCHALEGRFRVVRVDRDCEDCIAIDLTSDESVRLGLAKIKESHGDRIASVLHLAAYFDLSGEPNPLYDAVNVDGTRRLLSALQGFDVEQFVYASTMLVHAPTRPGLPIAEDAPLQASWPYPQSKLKAEEAIRERHGQRLPIIALAFVGLFVSRYLAAYQLGHIDSAWDPLFGDGTERIITSEVSKAWPVPDAGLGAVTYILEILTGFLGDKRRWRTAPWVVILFGLMIVPLGAVSIFFIIIQPIVIGTWCTLCLVAAVAMLMQIPYSFDELLASGQFLLERRRQGQSLLRAFLFGDTIEGGSEGPRDEFAAPARTVIRESLGGGVNLPWSLAASLAVGMWLMCTRLTFGTTGAQADSDHLLGALIITVSMSALAEVARPLRFINLLFGIALVGAPLLFDGGTPLADWAGGLAGVLLIVLSIPRGTVRNHYGSWNRAIV